MGIKHFLGKIIKAPVKLVHRAVQPVEKGADFVMSAMVFGIIRHLLTTFGGTLVAHGYATGSDLDAAIGALITIIGFVWSVINKKRQQ